MDLGARSPAERPVDVSFALGRDFRRGPNSVHEHGRWRLPFPPLRRRNLDGEEREYAERRDEQRGARSSGICHDGLSSRGTRTCGDRQSVAASCRDVRRAGSCDKRERFEWLVLQEQKMRGTEFAELTAFVAVAEHRTSRELHDKSGSRRRRSVNPFDLSNTGSECGSSTAPRAASH